MKKPIATICILATTTLFAAEHGRDYKFLGYKHEFANSNKLEEISVSDLVKFGSSLRLGGEDVITLPCLAPKVAFVVGYPYVDGREELVYIKNDIGAEEILSFTCEEKAHYYLTSDEYVEGC